MDNKAMIISYWSPRVIRHCKNGIEEFAIHEAYFNEDNKLITYTEDALSPRESSKEKLREKIFILLEQEEVATGDLHYAYSKEDLLGWIKCFDAPCINFDE